MQSKMTGEKNNTGNKKQARGDREEEGNRALLKISFIQHGINLLVLKMVWVK